MTNEKYKDYELRSLPGRSVEIPEEYFRVAEAYLKVLTSNSPQALIDNPDLQGCLKSLRSHPEIFEKIDIISDKFIKNSDSSYFTDLMYLGFAVAGNLNDFLSGKISKEEGLKKNEDLTVIVNEVNNFFHS